MSGTSLDGLDIALVKINGVDLSTQVTLKHFRSIEYSDDYLNCVTPIFANPNAPLKQVAYAHKFIAEYHAKLVLECLDEWKINAKEVDLIASHGQTVFHCDDEQRFTMQLGDGDHLAQLTGITTLSDFRQKHIAAGGRGAPLAPYADYLLYQSDDEDRILLNIGGISNYSYLPRSSPFKHMLCADAGPGNTLMNAWVKHHRLNEYGYDRDAQLAQQGHCHELLLNTLLSDPYFKRTPPKTTGPEYFNLNWLNTHIESLQVTQNISTISTIDILTTLNELSSHAIAEALRHLNLSSNATVYVSGGGAYNPKMMSDLSSLIPNQKVIPIDTLGISSDAKEAVLFAILANQSLFASNQVFAGHVSMPAVSFGKLSMPD